MNVMFFKCWMRCGRYQPAVGEASGQGVYSTAERFGGLKPHGKTTVYHEAILSKKPDLYLLVNDTITNVVRHFH